MAKSFATALALVAGSASGLVSTFQYTYKMTYSSADPVDAVNFVTKYLGAVEYPQPHKGGNGTCAMVKWAYFPNTNPDGASPYMFHFVKGYNYPNGSMTIDEFEARMFALHGNMTSFDQFMDFHVTLAVDDLDPIASKLHNDGIPLLVRRNGGNYSMFLEVPHAIIVEIVSPKLTVLAPQPWDRCGGAVRPESVDTSALEEALHAPIPTIKPLRAVYASSDPAAEAAFIQKQFGATRLADLHDIEQALGSGNGTCYEAQAVRFENHTNNYRYEIWWVRAPKARVGAFTISEYEEYLRALHRRNGHPKFYNTSYDEYMDFHLGLVVGDTNPLVEEWLQEKIDFFLVDQYGHASDIFVQGPSGQTYELLSSHLTIPHHIQTWNLCGDDPESYTSPTASYPTTTVPLLV